MTKLKPFQMATVEVVMRAFCDEGGSRRFLIADEVGLGKTVVAQEVIRQMMRRKHRPLVVLYVCSNQSIAHQNRRKILEVLEGDTEGAVCEVDRLTLTAATAQPTHPKLHLYTLTPGTSIPGRSTTRPDGRQDERALIHVLVEALWPEFLKERGEGFFQFNAQKYWFEWVDSQRHKIAGKQRLLNAFNRSVRHEFAIPKRACLVPAIRRQTSKWDLIKHFRNALAAAALEDITPDLVIMDEFQRFRDLVKLEVDPAAARVIERLRGDDLEHPPALLLLSATPYRLYSLYREDPSGTAHHDEFFELVEFLYRDKDIAARQRKACEEGLNLLARELRRGRPDSAEAQAARDSVQEILRPIMARTERADCGLGGSAAGISHLPATLIPDDLRVYRHLHDSFASQHRSSAVYFWTSIPLPMQTMGTAYRTWQEATPIQAKDLPALRRPQRDRFRYDGEWPHPRLRALESTALTDDLLALPWMPPSLRWWALDGAWKSSGPPPSKLLIFSRFQAVPQAVAALLSYDLERRLFAGQSKLDYAEITRRKALQPKADRHALLALFTPWPWLIAATEPLAAAGQPLDEVRRHLGDQIRKALRKLASQDREPGQPTGQKSRRSLWQLLAQIEAQAGNWALVKDAWDWLRPDLQKTNDLDAGLGGLLPRWEEEAQKPLGSISPEEIQDLAEYALSAPGVVLGRALKRHWPDAMSKSEYSIVLETAWSGLRTYLDQRWFFAVLKGDSDETYPEAIRQAVVDGNLEAVLDEQFWITGQVRSLEGADLARELKDSLRVRTSVSGLYPPDDKGTDHAFSLRCHVALPFTQRQMQTRSHPVGDQGDGETRSDPVGDQADGETRFRPDDLRRSFNSPFWPHVLATTSVGQEGLDFHLWCKGLVHWDLCSNPVDLEQREGRIQRYGGLATRQVLANKLRSDALQALKRGQSPWVKLSEMAEKRLADESGLAPWWVCDGAEIERYVFDVPLSEQGQRLPWVQQQRALYRMVLGQFNQEDLVATLSRELGQNGVDLEALRRAMLQLSPWFGTQPGPEAGAEVESGGGQ